MSGLVKYGGNCLTLSLSGSLLLAPLTISAQERGALPSLEEVVVTAQKREQSIQDVGFAVNAFDEEDATRFATDVGALAGQAPGVESYGNNSYFQSFFIRGIGLNEFSGNYNPPVAVHNDEVYVSKNWANARPSFDIGRIEVLKGPQGTLFGRNTTGGAVNYYTNRPSDVTEGYVRASGDEHSRFSLEGALTGALSDSVAGRLSFYRGFGSGGAQFNEFTGDDHGEPDVTEVRAQLEWHLSDLTTVRTLIYAGDDQSELQGYKSPGIFNSLADGGGFCPEILSGAAQSNPGACVKFLGVTGDDGIEREPNDINTINQNAAPKKDDDFSGGYVRVEHDFGDATFTSITAFDKYDRFNQEDADGTPIASNDVFYRNELELFSQELRLTGLALDDRLNYVAGIFYSDEDLFQEDVLDFSETGFNLAPISAGLPPSLFGRFDQQVTSLAVYFNLDYNVTDNLVFTLGGRHTNDETEIDAVTGAALVDGTLLAAVDSVNDDRTDKDTSYRLGLSYNLGYSTLLYANLVSGFRTGGYSVPFGGTIVEFEEESVQSLEVGFKSDLSDTLRFNTAGFFYTYDDRQINVDDPVSPVVPITRNISESDVYGLEAELTWLASHNVEVKLGYSYLDAEFTETDRSVTTIALGGPVALEGNVPVNSPKHQLNGSFEYVGAINDDINWAAYLDFRWVDDRFLEVTNQRSDTAEAYTVVNANIGIQSADEHWDFSVWVKNLTDEEYLVYINNLPGPGFALNIYGEQRTAGLTVGYRF